MFEPGAWLHISFGFFLGVISTFYALAINKSLSQRDKILAFIRKIIGYTISVSVTTFLYFVAIVGGVLEEWQPLGMPLPLSEKAVKIMGIGYVQTTSGSIYHWNNPYSYEGEWEKVDEIKIDPSYRIYDSCSSITLWFLPIKRNNFIDYKKACITWGPGTSTIAFAINEGGAVYQWFNDSGEMEALIPIIFAIEASFAGFGFSIFILIVLMVANFIFRTQRD